MMKKDTLFLHVGWSKTGTSAIQAQIQAQKEDFLAEGILYPQSLQWPDHSHHPFALSFKGSGTYQSDMTPGQALEALRLEMQASPAQSVLLSSELSPFYFNNPRFRAFVKEHFETVKVMFTVRPQSELLLSLFNQLVKDPNVRYGGTPFVLAMRNIQWLNFYKKIVQWSGVVGKENIMVVPYSKNVVQDFFRKLELFVREDNDSVKEKRIVNPSMPTRCLALLQARGSKATDAASFERIKNEVIELAEKTAKKNDTYNLFLISEQRAFDEYYEVDNKLLQNEFSVRFLKESNKEYSQFFVLPPGF